MANTRNLMISDKGFDRQKKAHRKSPCTEMENSLMLPPSAVNSMKISE
jgi:hypothetical protein